MVKFNIALRKDAKTRLLFLLQLVVGWIVLKFLIGVVVEFELISESDIKNGKPIRTSDSKEFVCVPTAQTVAVMQAEMALDMAKDKLKTKEETVTK